MTSPLAPETDPRTTRSSGRVVALVLATVGFGSLGLLGLALPGLAAAVVLRLQGSLSRRPTPS